MHGDPALGFCWVSGINGSHSSRCHTQIFVFCDDVLCQSVGIEPRQHAHLRKIRRKFIKAFTQRRGEIRRCWRNKFHSSTAFLPVRASQRRMITSQYAGSISIMRQARPVCSHAIKVEPLPPNGSRTTAPGSVLLQMRYASSRTGFIVG